MNERLPSDDSPPPKWWMQQTERRVNEIHVNLEALWRDFREQVARGTAQQFSLNNLDERVREVRKQLDELRETIRDEHLTKQDFEPYRKGIILVLSTIVVAVLGALLRLVVTQH